MSALPVSRSLRYVLGEYDGPPETKPVSRDLVSRVTDAVVEQMQQWQSRRLDSVYSVVLIDATVLKICDGQVANRPVYVAMGITVDGERDVLGLWDRQQHPPSLMNDRG